MVLHRCVLAKLRNDYLGEEDGQHIAAIRARLQAHIGCNEWVDNK